MHRISFTAFVTATVLVLNLPGHNQLSVSKTFTPMTDSTVLLNPERGFYYVLDMTVSTDFNPSLSISDVLGLIPTNNQNISILLVEIFLDSFIASDISATVLDKLKNVIFPAVRSLNVKCLVRFAYTNDIVSNGIQDATETQLKRHINQLTPILQANSDLIFVLQAGLIGAWGEWYYSSNYASSVDQSVNAAQKAARNRIITALLKAVPSDKMIQLRTPSYKQIYCNTTANLTPQQAFSSSYPCARIGIHNDCFMAPWGDEGTFANDAQRVWLTNEALYVMTGGESCMVNGNYTSCAGGISQVKAQRFTYLNRDYHPDIISGWVKNGCYNTIANMLGYRFQLINGTFPTSVTRGTIYQATVSISNTGVAPLYNSRPVQVILRNKANNQLLSTFLQSAIDPRRWAPGSTVSLSLSFTTPSTVATGSYDVILNLPDAAASLSNQPLARILFANSGGVQEAKTRYNILSQVNIV